MKVTKPLIAFLVLLVIISFAAGILYPTLGSILSYSSTAYLLVSLELQPFFLKNGTRELGRLRQRLEQLLTRDPENHS